MAQKSQCFRRLEIRIQQDLSKILQQEELAWFQRSRATWLANGTGIQDTTMSKQCKEIEKKTIFK